MLTPNFQLGIATVGLSEILIFQRWRFAVLVPEYKCRFALAMAKKWNIGPKKGLNLNLFYMILKS